MGDLSKHFSRHEFACSCGCGCDTIDFETLSVLEAVRSHFKAPVGINSAYRCKNHNSAVGGSSDSQHLRGRACDIVVEGVDPSDVQQWLKLTYDGKYGIGVYNTFTHIDTRSNGPARWTG